MKNTEKVTFQDDGKEYTLTIEEIMAAYRYWSKQLTLVERQSLLPRARYMLHRFNPFWRNEIQGMTREEASSPEMISEYVEWFAEAVEDYGDDYCYENEEEIWEKAFRCVLKKHSATVPPKAKEYEIPFSGMFGKPGPWDAWDDDCDDEPQDA